MDVVVTGIGLVTALGDREATWHRLLQGETAIRHHQPFPEQPPRPLAMLAPTPTPLQTLTPRVVMAALKDAQLTPPLPDCGVVVGSSRGNQAAWEALARGDQGLHVTDWEATLPHAAAVQTATLLQTRQAVRSPMSACATGLWAIAQAYDQIRAGAMDCVLAGAVETPITPLTLSGFDRMGALAATGAYPFDEQREGLVLGEGGAVLVLESQARAEQRQVPIYGVIRGFGLTADGYHLSAPEPGSPAAIAAVRQCLRQSHLHPTNIDYIHAHGTATRLNDQNEAQLIRHLLPPTVAVSSTKGGTGHTIGASGAIGAALCLLALRDQVCPPTVGLTQPDFDLNLVTVPRPCALDHVLCFSFGFGGQNAVVAIARTA